MVKDIRYIIKRIIIGVGVAICMYFFRNYLFLNCYALERVQISNWQMVYTDGTANDFDNQFIYRLGQPKYLQAINVWFPRFTGYYYGNVVIEADPAQFPTGANLSPTWFDLYVQENGSFNTNVNTSRTCTSDGWSCTFHFSGVGVQSNNYSLLIQILKHGNTSIYYPAFRVSGSLEYDNSSSGISSGDFNNGVNNIIVNNNNNANNIINNQIENQRQTNDAMNNINGSITDDTGGDVPSSWFDNFKDNSTSPVSDLITMPITLLQAYMNGFNSSCSSINLGNLYGTNIILPCIDIENYLGSNLWGLIDSLFTIFMVYNIGMLCVSIYEGITSLDDDMQMLYTPRHAASGRVARGEQEGLY